MDISQNIALITLDLLQIYVTLSVQTGCSAKKTAPSIGQQEFWG